MEDVAQVVVVDPVHQLAEHGEALALVRHQRILVPHGPEVDALAEVVHLGQVVLPPLVDDLQHDVALELAGRLLAAGDALVPLRVQVEGLGEDALGDLADRAGAGQVVGHELGREVLGDLGDQAGEVPLLGVLRRARRGHHLGHRALEQLDGVLVQVLSVDDLVAAAVDHLALLVHHVVVLEDVLAGFGVAALDGVLGPLDGLGDHLRLDGHVVGKGPAHHPVHGAGGEQPHQIVLEGQEEPALARIALTTRPAPQLVVDAAALVALAAEHVEPAEGADLVALRSQMAANSASMRLQLGRALVGGHVDAPGRSPPCAPGPRDCPRG